MKKFKILFPHYALNSYAQLKVVSPNGSEKLLQGSTFIIKWSGVQPTDDSPEGRFFCGTVHISVKAPVE